jgi:hypothetical protein
MAETTLTAREKLVRHVPEVAPRAEHYLLVFKKVGPGWKLRASLAPGEPFKKGLLEPAGSLAAYIVPSDEHLRYRFSRTYKTHDQIHTFQLDLTLEYRVSDPVALVQKLEADPLKRVVDEIDHVLVQRIKSVDWPAVEHEQIDLEKVLFEISVFTDGHEVVTGYNKIRRFAGLQGLEIQRITVVRELPEEEIQVSTTAVKSSREQQMLALQHGTKTLRQDLGFELADQSGGFRRRQKVADGMTNNIVRAFDQATENIRSLDDIERAVPRVAAIQGAMAGVATGVLPAAQTGLLPGNTTVTGLLPGTAGQTGLPKLLGEIVTGLASLPCDPSERKRLLSFALHIVAETVRGDDASQETLDRYMSAVNGKFTDLFQVLGQEQVRLLRRLQDPAGLKKELD